ncbi:uncharacterized protein FA14DRAFT_176603 [Meira miltonrushii]|uniref:F-box domain-containing protein n=1 Tax=Meira miltonrushii TaxID=1280837 RepID=A0A316VP59_9BASI|nr:uncharacterized protein FA14DRAFT_176603 [Meira miltonrushii]PWN37305.1 hypothetical protein FA14DRAFT_176603 [Meira miltonrushii]
MLHYLNKYGFDDRKTGVPQLPVELLHIIFEHYMSTVPERREQELCTETREICKLARVNRTFQAFFKPLLWKRVCIFGAKVHGEKITSRSCFGSFQALPMPQLWNFFSTFGSAEHKEGFSWLGPGCGAFYESDMNLSKFSIPLIDSTVESISLQNSKLPRDVCDGDTLIDWLEDDPQSQFGFRLKHKEQPTVCHWFVQQCMIGAEHSLKEVNFDCGLSPLDIPALYPLWIYFERVRVLSCLDAGKNRANNVVDGIAWLRRLLLQYEGQRDGNWIQELITKEYEAFDGREPSEPVPSFTGLDGRRSSLWRLKYFLRTLGFRFLEDGFGLVGDMDSNLQANLAKVVERLKKQTRGKRLKKQTMEKKIEFLDF